MPFTILKPTNTSTKHLRRWTLGFAALAFLLKEQKAIGNHGKDKEARQKRMPGFSAYIIYAYPFPSFSIQNSYSPLTSKYPRKSKPSFVAFPSSLTLFAFCRVGKRNPRGRVALSKAAYIQREIC